MAVYQTYVNAMNDKIRKAININNPFVFKHISNLKVETVTETLCIFSGLTVYSFQSMDHFDDIGPSVVMASPGMMQSGLSRELFESWCTDKRNGVIIAGYCVEGTLAKVRAQQDSKKTFSEQSGKRCCDLIIDMLIQLHQIVVIYSNFQAIKFKTQKL